MLAPDNYTLASNYSPHPERFLDIAFYPKASLPETPDHLPPNVEQFYIEAVRSLNTAPNAAGAMFRKTLDVGLKSIDPDGKGNLFKRIKAAQERGLLTKEMAEWATKIRLDGNDAAHDGDPFTTEEAAVLHKFTDLVMRYLFTLPGMLKDANPLAHKDEATAPGA